MSKDSLEKLKKGRIECLNCHYELKKGQKKCSNCGAIIENMTPKIYNRPCKPYFMEDLKENLVWLFYLIPFAFFAGLLRGDRSFKYFALGFFGFYLVAFIVYVIIYFIRLLYYPTAWRKYNLYENFHDFEEDKRKREEHNNLMKSIEKNRREKEVNLEIGLMTKYGNEIARLENSFFKLILFDGYLVEVFGNKIRNEFDLSGYYDCNLIYDKLLKQTRIVLLYPTTQSKVDVLLHGQDGDYIAIENIEASEVNKFFIILKKEVKK